MPKTIDQLILNSPYQEPAEYWSYKREKREFTRKQGRRLAGASFITSAKSRTAPRRPGG